MVMLSETEMFVLLGAGNLDEIIGAVVSLLSPDPIVKPPLTLNFKTGSLLTIAPFVDGSLYWMV